MSLREPLQLRRRNYRVLTHFSWVHHADIEVVSRAQEIVPAYFNPARATVVVNAHGQDLCELIGCINYPGARWGEGDSVRNPPPYLAFRPGDKGPKQSTWDIQDVRSDFLAEKPTGARVERLARKWGPLGRPAFWADMPSRARALACVESIRRWQETIVKFRWLDGVRLALNERGTRRDLLLRQFIDLDAFHAEFDERGRLVQGQLGNEDGTSKTVIRCHEAEALGLRIQSFGWTAAPSWLALRDKVLPDLFGLSKAVFVEQLNGELMQGTYHALLPGRHERTVGTVPVDLQGAIAFAFLQKWLKGDESKGDLCECANPACNKAFYAERKNRRHCSGACRTKAHRIRERAKAS